MKKLTPIRLFILIAFMGFSTGIHSQPRSQKELKNEFTTSLEIKKDDFTEAAVIYTKPNRDLAIPEIQMIAQNIMLDSINSYHIRIDLFTQITSVNEDEVFIISSSEIHEFNAIEDNSNIKSRIVDVVSNWGWSNRKNFKVEGFIYTYFLETSEEDFFKIIASEDIKVRFSDMCDPVKVLTDSNTSKINDLYTFLTAGQRINRHNL